MKMEQILISDSAYNSDELYGIVYENSKIMGYLLAQGLKAEQIHADALASYYVNYYFSQVNSGGYSKFLHHSKWDAEINSRIAYGLQAMNAMQHLAFFLKQEAEVNEIPRETLESFFAYDYFVDNPIKAQLDADKSFYFVDDEIVELNGQWLKEHKDTKVLSMDEIFKIVEEVTGKAIEQ